MSDSSTPPPSASPTGSDKSAKSGGRRQSAVRASAANNKTPLPRYTSIDLENELPEIYNTSLNPNLHDPDMTMFFNRNAPPFHTNYAKRHSPPPSYTSRTTSASCSSRQSLPIKSKPGGGEDKKSGRIKCFIISLFCVFFAAPVIIFIIYLLIATIVNIDPPLKKY